MIGCLDVQYRGPVAWAACVLLDAFSSPNATRSKVVRVADVADYQPGKFYLRELPCLTAVLRSLNQLPDALVIDGYVWISAAGAPGLGARLHEEVGRIVIGVAKTEYLPMRDSPLVAPVCRGSSTRPLFVTSIGMDAREAAALVSAMHGAHRLPDALRLADQLARVRASQEPPFGE